MSKLPFRRPLSLLLLVSVVALGAAIPPGYGQELDLRAPVIHKVRGATDRIEMTVDTSRRLVLEQPIPETNTNFSRGMPSVGSSFWMVAKMA